MTKPPDLTGQRWGRLVAVAAADRVWSASGKSSYAAWLCRCDCGREQVFVTTRLPYCASNAARKDAATECDHCKHQRTCNVCGRVFDSALYRVTCSDDCALEQRRANDLEHYYRAMERSPDRNVQMRAERKARAAADPAYAEHWQAQQRAQAARKMARIYADPERLARVNEARRERYAQRSAEVLARRHERKADLSDDEREAINAKARERYAQSADAKRKQARERDADPVRRALRAEKSRANYAERAAEILARRHARRETFLASLSPQERAAQAEKERLQELQYERNRQLAKLVALTPELQKRIEEK